MRALLGRDLEGVVADRVGGEGHLLAAGDGTERADGAVDLGVGQALAGGRAQVELGFEVLEVEREVQDVEVVDGGLSGGWLDASGSDERGAGDAEADGLHEGTATGLEVDGALRLLGGAVEVAGVNHRGSP